ncbi:MAG: protease inhibitor I42 family protein [Burkholderiaceae bacterium]|jgi:inhibitor of cysteine peptidase|nr:protease inhibitor I42 family protein [Burkholderiaceae bacterium]
MRKAAGCVALVLLLAACRHTSGQALPLVSPDADSAGQTLRLALNQEIVVRLPDNPSTGFGWAVVHMPVFMEQLGTESLVRDEQGDAAVAGAGGTRVWRFRAIAVGEDSLRFIYRRPWEKGTPPAKTVSYHLVIE